jgi:DNA-binding GntR family transcriptional regulator
MAPPTCPQRSPRCTVADHDRTAYDDMGRAVEYGSHLYRASRYSFSLTLVDR